MIRKAFVLLILLGLASIFYTLLSGFEESTQLNQTAEFYTSQTAEDIGAANYVAGIIVTYRGLDTIGEVTVLFLTAAIIGLVLSHQFKQAQSEAETLTPAGEMLRVGSRLLSPLILLFGAYVFVNGHLTPGGGFQGGAIIASAFLLILISDPLKSFGHRLITLIESISGFSFVTIGILGVFIGGGFLDSRILPLGTVGELLSAGTIPIIYSLIGLKVGAEFSSMLVNLAGVERKK